MKVFSGRRLRLALLGLAAAVPFAVDAQTMRAPDIARDPTLYVVPYAHLDTQWRWEMPQTISEYLLKTLRVNFNYIDTYPHYLFNWTGSNRYRLMKEYFPDDYARLKRYVAEGRWFPAGSSVEEGDVNLPSAEGILRQVLYGNEYYRREFGKASNEYMLPDCFGFPASLPSILAHAGVSGFSTQKLSSSWQPAPIVGGPGSPEQTPQGIPFNVGRWTGPDGRSVIAALNPGDYGSDVYTDLSARPDAAAALQLTAAQMEKLTPAQRAQYNRRPVEQDWTKRIAIDGEVTGLFADYHYVGTGDVGGATRESSAKLLEAIVDKSETTLPVPPQLAFLAASQPAAPAIRVGEGPVHVVIATADQMFNDMKSRDTTRLPVYAGDLELINHSAGSLTSEAYHKRWVLRNEVLADAAEKASLAAAWLGALAYPQQRLNDAWTLALGGHFHDTGAGTATPQAYQFAWNDDVIVANQFAGVFTEASAAVASAMDTRGAGVPIVIFNPLNVARQDVVEATVAFPGGLPSAVRVTGPQGNEVPGQVTADGKVLFAADLPAVGYAVYHVQPAKTQTAEHSLKVTPATLENARYRVTLNPAGDVSSIFDKRLERELLSAPLRLALTTDKPKQWPAWNMDYEQVEAAPRGYVSGPAQIRIKENGPVRVALEVTRETEDSKYVQTIRLAAGAAGERVEFANVVDWRTHEANLKATFSLTASNRNATYNQDLGTIERPTATARQFEVGTHQWMDLTDGSGAFGVTVLTASKNGTDKPDEHTLRLTLLRSPGIQQDRTGRPGSYSDQANQDWGHHEFTFGLAGHAGDWRAGATDWQGYRLNNPPMAMTTTAHAGALGPTFSLLRVSDPRVRVLALKKAEESDEWVIRLVELDGRPAADVHVAFPAAVVAAREVTGQEQPVGAAEIRSDVRPEIRSGIRSEIRSGELVASFTPFQPRTFALRVAPGAAPAAPVTSQPVTLAYDLAVATDDDTATPGGGFDGRGDALPAEMLPSHLVFAGVGFELAPAKTGVADAVVARGQSIPLPAGSFNRVYVLAAANGGDQKASFRVGGQLTDVTVEDWGGFVGQWDTRLWKQAPARDWAISAHHAVWPPANLEDRERPSPSPVYPDDYLGLQGGYIKPASLAWYASHHHTATGLNEPYAYSYLFAYAFDLPAGATSLTLPQNDRIRVLAVSVARQAPALEPVQPLFDPLQQVTGPLPK